MEGNRSGNRYRTLASDIIIFIMGTVLAKAIQFFLMPLYTTYMTTEAYGVAELTNNLSELLFPIATLCIYEAAFRFAVDPDFDNNKLATAVSKVIVKSLVVGFLISIVCRYVFHYQYSFYLFFILYTYSIRMCGLICKGNKNLKSSHQHKKSIRKCKVNIICELKKNVFTMDKTGYLKREIKCAKIITNLSSEIYTYFMSI